uniref:U-actitoxin-Bgr3a n=1 Tax=Bunodosoma granuliferum TaxID=31164 RepID=BDS3A_BUNGR|nr:RecName: Full=U-actitoxin-Bgr3a; Short=U-AITX-Bgr3a; AltName: Full=U-AITX-Bg1b; Flags: Precursor [Bunodosoma granuliferum]CCC86603.1 U-AITX-Bg1b protein [Bunodosoma granuliferum]
MSAQRFLFLLVVTSLIAASLAAPKDVQLTKRGTPCWCGKTVGIYWFALYSCPGGHGYTGHCGQFMGVCCYPADP